MQSSNPANGKAKNAATINPHRTPFQIEHLAISSSRDDYSNGHSAISSYILPHQMPQDNNSGQLSSRIGNNFTTADQPLDMSKSNKGLILPQMQQLPHIQTHQSDSDIDEHFRRSLGKDYNKLLVSKNRANVEEHFQKALGDIYKKLPKSSK